MLVVLSSIAWSARSAEDDDALDEDFLAYLAEFEGEQDDWTIIDQETVLATADKPKSEAVKPASAKTPPKTPAPKPATPDDGSKQ